MSPSASKPRRGKERRFSGRRRQLTALLLGGYVLTAGCAGGAAHDVVHVEITDNGFDPALTVVPAGSEVRFWSNSPHVHTVTSAHGTLAGEANLPEGAEEFDSGRLREGETFTLTFDVTGDHVFWCEIHRDEQMVGVVRVTDS